MEKRRKPQNRGVNPLATADSLSVMKNCGVNPLTTADFLSVMKNRGINPLATANSSLVATGFMPGVHLIYLLAREIEARAATQILDALTLQTSSCS